MDISDLVSDGDDSPSHQQQHVSDPVYQQPQIPQPEPTKGDLTQKPQVLSPVKASVTGVFDRIFAPNPPSPPTPTAVTMNSNASLDSKPVHLSPVLVQSAVHMVVEKPAPTPTPKATAPVPPMNQQQMNQQPPQTPGAPQQPANLRHVVPSRPQQPSHPAMPTDIKDRPIPNPSGNGLDKSFPARNPTNNFNRLQPRPPIQQFRHQQQVQLQHQQQQRASSVGTDGTSDSESRIGTPQAPLMRGDSFANGGNFQRLPQQQHQQRRNTFNNNINGQQQQQQQPRPISSLGVMTGKRGHEDAFGAIAIKDLKSRLVVEMKLDSNKAAAMCTVALSKNPTSQEATTLDAPTPTSNQPKAIIFGPSAAQPEQWKFKMTMPTGSGIPFEKSDPPFVTLTTCSITRARPPGNPTFLLEGEYTMKELLPRSFYNLLSFNGIPHTFVFNFTNPEHAAFKEMAGLRKTGYIIVKEASSNEIWELHLKVSRERTNIFGYLIRASEVRRFVQINASTILAGRRLPLVLDLDDTLVRMIGTEEGRYVPPAQAMLVPDRVRPLADGRKVVLTERVEEFLQWASKYYDISVCSVGDQAYVDQVIAVLDPSRSIIRGVGYSARAEYMHIQGTSMPKRPPKDLESLFVYPTRARDVMFTGALVEAMIVDDNVHMWPLEQQDSIIVVREQRNAKVWNVQLFPHVQSVLNIIHGEFFKQLDQWDMRSGALGPSTCQLYKEYLRNELARRIADPVPGSGRENSVHQQNPVNGLGSPAPPSGLPAHIVQAAISTPVLGGKVMSPMIGAFTLPDD
ncbi:hypothetical protein HDU80_004237 [Chytriomyces hyalinus]|nr:hypothetical protein HDU80_004237 [Chytriomyces hyalinus]